MKSSSTQEDLIRFKFLARTLAMGYMGLVIYVSLIPFEGWDLSELSSTPPFWLRPMDNYWTFADLFLNIIAYIPISALLFLGLKTTSAWKRSLFSLLIAALLSFSMEFLQQMIPGRIASPLDWLTNTLGAAIGLIGVRTARKNNEFLTSLLRCYSHFFYSEPPFLVGQALLALWCIAHINPAIPPFSFVYQRPVPSEDVIRIWIEAIQIAFQCLGGCLFFSLLLKPHRWLCLSTLFFLAFIITIKYTSSEVLFHSGYRLIHPHQWLGIGIGVTWLAILLWLPSSKRKIASGVAMLSSIGVTFLGKDLLQSSIPFELFSWSYGQLTHFNQLTYTTIWASTTAMIFQLAFLHGHHDEPLTKDAS
jgi:VanZ family protein